MTVSYLTFLKHAEIITKSTSAARPVLKGVYHHPNKSLIVTDSHRLYVAKDAHSRDDGAIIAPKTGEIIEGNYPDISRLLPETKPSGVIYIEDVKQTLAAVKTLLAAGGTVKSGEKKPVKNKTPIKLSCDDEKKVTLKTESECMKAEYFLTYADEVEPGFTITFSAEYFAQALALFKEAGYINEKVSLKFYGSLRPFVLNSYNDSLRALISPIRTY